MLKVDVHSGYSPDVFLGSYVLRDGVLSWEGEARDPFYDWHGIRASDDIREGWIEPDVDPERWLRRLPGFLDMRGTMYAKIVADT